jgi:hypothetical protein
MFSGKLLRASAIVLKLLGTEIPKPATAKRMTANLPYPGEYIVTARRTDHMPVHQLHSSSRLAWTKGAFLYLFMAFSTLHPKTH